jgi:hypothetical protein
MKIGMRLYQITFTLGKTVNKKSPYISVLWELHSKGILKRGDWYYLWTEDGVNIRILDEKQKDNVRDYLKSTGVKFKELSVFTPATDEYPGIVLSCNGDRVQQTFLGTSSLALEILHAFLNRKNPDADRYMTDVRTNLERMIHIFAHMCGIISHEQEARILSRLTLERAMIAGEVEQPLKLRQGKSKKK